MKSILKRTWNLIRTAQAARQIRNSPDEEKRDRARRYLMELLGQSRGLPTKIGQFLALDGNPELGETLAAAVPALPFEEVESILDQAYGGDHRGVYKKMNPAPCPASLGQVHRAQLCDGRTVAVKVRYPRIAEDVESELKLLGWLPEMGPAKRWGFHWAEYMQALRDNFENELDYRREAAWQQRYHRLAAPLEDIVVPRVVPEHVRDNVLVQTWEPGLSLEDASRLPAEERFNFGRALLRQYLFMLFRHGIAHADPNPGNFAFRVGGEGPPQVVVYDYGSVFEITRDERMTLLRTLLALQAREAVDPAACLAGLGFDVEKLKDVRPCLAALLGVLFEPFLVDRPFDVNDWDINQRFDAIVGELKWWFRSAAPPRMIFLMRALHGLTSHLKKLDVRLIWRRVLDEVGSDLFRQAMSFPLPPPPPGGNGETNFRSLSQYLKVHVEKCNGNKVELTMPARVVDELEDVIDPPVLATIRDNGIELEVIKRQVQRSGYAPQTLFQVKDPERDVRVWLE